MQIPLKNYRIVTDEPSSDKAVRVPDVISVELGDLFEGALKGKASTKDRLGKLINKYPNVPILKYFLANWYVTKNENTEADKLFRDLSQRFPDFVLGRTSQIARLLDLYETGKVGDYFKNNFDIGFHFPARKEFDLMEYETFMSNVIHYLTMTGHYEKAEEQIALVEKVDDNNEFINEMSQIVSTLKAAMRDEEDEDENYRSDFQIVEPTLPQRVVPVIPASALFQFLYNVELWHIDVQKLEDNIVHNKEALLAEVGHILFSAIESAEYCRENDEWTPAVLHALLLAAYLDDENTFAGVFQLLGQPEKYIEFWVGDDLGTLILPYFKTFSDTRLQAVKDFLLQRPGNSYSKMMMADLLAQFVVYMPHSRHYVVTAIQEVLEYYIGHSEDCYLADPDVVDCLVSTAINIRATELMGLISKLYELDMVIGDEGTPDECEQAMMDEDRAPFEYDAYDNIYEHLGYLKEINRDDNDSDDDDGDSDELFGQELNEVLNKRILKEKERQSVTIDKPEDKKLYLNVSKNAPCPCGSGKKYKRCHGL